MRLPFDALIALEKVTSYLLVRQVRSDKSAFLERAGFTPLNPEALIAEIRQMLTIDAVEVEKNEFGRYFEIVGFLSGPTGVRLRVKSIWMREHLSGRTKFITLIPLKIEWS